MSDAFDQWCAENGWVEDVCGRMYQEDEQLMLMGSDKPGCLALVVDLYDTWIYPTTFEELEKAIEDLKRPAVKFKHGRFELVLRHVEPGIVDASLMAGGCTETAMIRFDVTGDPDPIDCRDATEKDVDRVARALAVWQEDQLEDAKAEFKIHQREVYRETGSWD